MTDYQDSCAHSTAEQIEIAAHDLSHSSEPTGAEPTFQAIATGPRPKLDRWPNLIERSSAERLLDFSREYDRALAFWHAADQANDHAPDAAAREKTEHTLAHAERILKEIREGAYLVPARTVREVALKARLMSHGKAELWDPANAADPDADIRFIIEDVLALGGLDRIKPQDFSFENLMPGYTGLGRTEALPALQLPRAATPAPCSPIHALGLELQMLWDLQGRINARELIDKRFPGTLERDEEAVTDRIQAIEAQITYMQPTSLPDVMIQLALIHNAFEAEPSKPNSASRAVSRMISGIQTFLSKAASLSFKEVGVEAYIKNLIATETKAFCERYDPDRFGETKMAIEQAA